MKFGKDFKNHLEETLPEWRDKFLCYKPLKKLIKQHLASELEDWFVKILNKEIDKFNDFYIDKEEDFVIRLQELNERIERVRISKNGKSTFESEFSEEILEICKAFVTIHGEIILLKHYSSLNFAGLVKILKKYDKRTGGMLSLRYTQQALNQPFFATDPLTRFVRECEANLELLFPLEAEVIESGTKESGEKSNAEASPANEDKNDVYRSILAAMKAIQGLRKASSTYNPLSLARFFRDQDDDEDASGAVTAENSDSNCPSTLQKNKESDQESVHSVDQEP